MTKVQKLATFDEVNAERDLLRLAVFDLLADTRTPFSKPVRVDCGKEFAREYAGDVFSVSVSMRGVPYYMVRAIQNGKVTGVEFHTETELEAQRGNNSLFWQMLRHAAWKLKQVAHGTEGMGHNA
jgi:hypothetical protein